MVGAVIGLVFTAGITYTQYPTNDVVAGNLTNAMKESKVQYYESEIQMVEEEIVTEKDDERKKMLEMRKKRLERNQENVYK